MTSFLAFWRLGYVRLVSIVPPDATISEGSSLLRRQDARGKAVGIRGRDGKWFGYDWLPHEADEHDLQRWAQMGAGVGIKTGQGLIGIDADTLDEQHAKVIAQAVTKHFGELPARIGKYPKCLYPLRVDAPIRYTRVEFGALDDKGRLRDRVEILSDGRQFVAHGIHPGTKKPYAWPRPLVPLEQLPVVSPAAVLAFMEELRTLLPAAKPLITEGATADVDQATLKGDLDTVRKAVSLIPNTSADFPTREAYRDFGYAIKAALPDQPDAAFELFAEWCGRWQEGHNDPGVVEADWRRMKPPFRRGANWLYELAERAAPTQFTRAEIFFQPIEPEADNPFAAAITENAFEPIAIKWVDPRDWQGVTPPPRRFLVDGMIPDGEVSLLTGEGGVGKTLSAQQLGTAVAAGLPFLGRNTIQSKVMMFLCEDSEAELHHRQRDINAALCLDMHDVSPNLRIASRKYMDNLLSLWDRSTGAMKRSAVWNALRTDALAFGAKLVVVDTIADTFGGSEIDRAQVRQFVQACLGRLAQEIGGAVLALGHPSKAGQAAGGDGTSGSTAWHATVRSRLYLEYATKDKTGPFRRLSNKKANYGPAGDQWMLRWHRGAFELVTAKSSATDTSVPSTTAAIDDAILAGVAELAAEGAALSDARNSPYWAPRVLRRRFNDVLGIYDMADIEAGWQRAVTSGRVREAVVGKKPNRHDVLGYELAPTEDETVFD